MASSSPGEVPCTGLWKDVQPAQRKSRNVPSFGEPQLAGRAPRSPPAGHSVVRHVGAASSDGSARPGRPRWPDIPLALFTKSAVGPLHVVEQRGSETKALPRPSTSSEYKAAIRGGAKRHVASCRNLPRPPGSTRPHIVSFDAKIATAPGTARRAPALPSWNAAGRQRLSPLRPFPWHRRVRPCVARNAPVSFDYKAGAFCTEPVAQEGPPAPPD